MFGLGKNKKTKNHPKTEEQIAAPVPETPALLEAEEEVQPVQSPPVELTGATAPDEPGQQPQKEKKTILMIEDDLFIAEMYKKQLEVAGYDVEMAMGGFEGERKLKEGNYDLLLLDLMLPGMNGLDILRRFQTEGVKLPVIIISNLEQSEVVTEGMALGAIKFLTKSAITPIDLCNEVDAYFAQR